MRTRTEALFIRVVVRRVRSGAAPFRWEIHGAETVDTIYISPDWFDNMEAAYCAGQARLGEFMPAAAPRQSQSENRFWRSRQNARVAQSALESETDALETEADDQDVDADDMPDGPALAPHPYVGGGDQAF